MNNRKFQKITSASVAAVLAASGSVAVLPVQKVEAASPFKDVPTNYFAYDAIIDLYERNVISGYGNGRFGPNDPVTRGQAAKMLAQVLGLNTKNVVNPGFKDLPKTHGFYGAIAALANEGIINGFLDKTFRPNEPITRGQMAIILTKGFEFQKASELTHTFDDVTANTHERFYIQTMYNLNIAKGKSLSKYAPYGKVSRGEMAAFITRAEKAQATANPLFEISDVQVVGNTTYAYVNGVKHTVDASLKSIFNAANAAALDGAFIEGQIADSKRILSLSKITFNASGSKTKLLQFNGGNSTFAGNVAITGNYLKFSNWNVTGVVTVEEESIRSVRAMRDSSPLQKVASLNNIGFIDWGQDVGGSESEGWTDNSNPSTGPADGSSNGSGLVTPPTGNETVYAQKMSPVNRHIEFVNSTIRYLVINATGTHISSTKRLPYVTVTGKTKNFELFADVESLYLEQDVNTTMFGVSKIKEVYKNSFKSVNFNADTTIDLMLVDNSNGWIDLGEFTYIEKVIIPPGKMPNDIFNDFINDNELIGDIEDPLGNEVDRDPVENTIVPDLEDPELDVLDIEVDGTSAKITFNSNEDGEIYYIVRKKDGDEPGIREILQNAGGKWSGKAIAREDQDVIVTVTDLEDRSEYIIYAVSVDEAGNISDKEMKEFRVTDATPPTVEIISAEALNGSTTAEIEFQLKNENGAIHYLIRQADELPPTAADIKRLGKTVAITDYTKTYTVRELKLLPRTQYVVYMVGEDEYYNLSTVEFEAFTTGEPDYLSPILKSTIDWPGDVDNWNSTEGRTQVTLHFDEALDKESAENVKNYVLSGTGNLRGNPYKAELINDRNGARVILTIPSMSAFVDNDTLVITVNKVADLAGNEVKPNSTAVLEFKSPLDAPEIKVVEVKNTENSSTKKDVHFNATEPGRYYYLVLPSMLPEDRKPKARDIIFPEEYLANLNADRLAYYSLTGSAAGGIINAPGNNVISGIEYNPNDPNFKKHVNGYDIYLVMQSRDGKYSEVSSPVKFIEDTFFPQISNFAFLETIPQNEPVVNETNLLGRINSEFGVISQVKTIDPETGDIVVEYENGNKLTIKTDGTRQLVDSKGTAIPNLSNKFKYDVDGNGEYNREEDYTFRFAIRFTEPMNKNFAENVNSYALTGKAGKVLQVEKAQLLSDEQTLILDLSVATTPLNQNYEEYSLIHTDDLAIHFKNLVDKQGLPLGGKYITNADGEITIDIPKHENDPLDGRNDVQFEYKDEIKPKLKSVRGIAINKNKEPSFDSSLAIGDRTYTYEGTIDIEFTFTEAIDTATLTTIDYIIEGKTGVYSATIVNNDPLYNTFNKDKLIIRVDAANVPNFIEDRERLKFNFGDTNLNITGQELVKDIEGNTITLIDPITNTPKSEYHNGFYRFRAIPYEITGVELSNPTSIGEAYQSQYLKVLGLLHYYTEPAEDNIQMYYGVSTRSNVSASDLLKPEASQIFSKFNNKVINNISDFVEIGEDVGTPFQSDQYISVVLIDGYGNVSIVETKKILHPPSPVNP